MAEVTIGVPVFNAEEHIAECLDCLCSQSFEDIEILVSDNGSTDRTVEIVETVARRDRRVRLLRQPFNIGVLHNYRAVLMQADTPFFLWRADDDLSDTDFVAKLKAALSVMPDNQLAAPTITTQRDVSVSDKTDRFPLEAWRQTELPGDIACRLELANASWFYGMWRTPYLQMAYTTLTSRFGFAYAHDPLLVAGAVMDDVIVGVPDTEFVQRTDSRGRKERASGQSFAERVSLREQAWLPFLATFRRMVDERNFDASVKGSLERYALKFARTHVVCTQAQFVRWQLRKLFTSA